jgi:cell division protein FtsQ
VPLRERLPDREQVRALFTRAGRTARPVAIAMLIVAALAVALGLGYRWVTRSPRFALASVELRGARELAEADVRRAVSPAMGENLFRLPLDRIEERLRAEPWVADVSVRRRLPDHLVVEVDEHRAAGVVDLGGMYLADVSGRVFKRADLARGEAAGLPVVTGIDRDAYRRRIDEAEERIRAALAAAAAYTAEPGRLPLGEVHADPDRGLTLYTRRPVVALHLGRPQDAAELRRRLALFDAAWAALSAAERGALSALHLDRDGSPVRVTVAFTSR